MMAGTERDEGEGGWGLRTEGHIRTGECKYRNDSPQVCGASLIAAINLANAALGAHRIRRGGSEDE